MGDSIRLDLEKAKPVQAKNLNGALLSSIPSI
jgi:hypothetical protein